MGCPGRRGGVAILPSSGNFRNDAPNLKIQAGDGFGDAAGLVAPLGLNGHLPHHLQAPLKHFMPESDAGQIQDIRTFTPDSGLKCFKGSCGIQSRKSGGKRNR